MNNQQPPDNVVKFERRQESEVVNEVVNKKDEIELDKFQVLETTLALTIRAQEYLTPKVKALLSFGIFLFTLLFRLLYWVVKMSIFGAAYVVLALAALSDYLSCSIAKKIHGA